MNYLILLLFLRLLVLCQCSYFQEIKYKHKAKIFGEDEITTLSSLTDDNYMKKVLNNLLIPRVVNTPNHEKVFNFIVNELKISNFSLEIDEFEEHTPIFGKLKFKNIIARLNPNANRYLVLACHYDSKYFQNFDFIGATDSAVPCAMLLSLMHTLRNYLSFNNDDLSLMFIFFDGEEAFQRWGPKDSLYGARHLANKWNENIQITKYNEKISYLYRIDVLVLLDLIGGTEATFYSYFDNTKNWHILLCNIEDKLISQGILKNKNKRYFHRVAGFAQIEDDHTPFFKKGVPILHLIPHPFPHYWHTINDNQQIIDFHTIEDINKILRVFVAEYLGLSV